MFVGKVVANISDVNPTENVPWLHLLKVSGDIADEVYRIFTVGGVAPSSVSFPVFAFGPANIRIYASLRSLNPSVLVGRQRTSPSNTLLNIGSMVVRWDWGPSDFCCLIWSTPTPLSDGRGLNGPVALIAYLSSGSPVSNHRFYTFFSLSGTSRIL